MNTDFRISLDYFEHPKVEKLKRRLGDAGVLSHLRLLRFAARHRPDGILSGLDAEDLAIAGGWVGEPGEFFDALLALRLLDEADEGVHTIHDWAEHNPWAMGSKQRSEAARKANDVRWGRLKDAQPTLTEQTQDPNRIRTGENRNPPLLSSSSPNLTKPKEEAYPRAHEREPAPAPAGEVVSLGDDDADSDENKRLGNPERPPEAHAILVEACQGTVYGANALVLEITRSLATIGIDRLREFNTMPPLKQALWVREAMGQANAKAKSSKIGYAARIIATAIADKRDLVAPPRAESNVASFQSRSTPKPERPSHPIAERYSDRPWAICWKFNVLPGERDHLISLWERAVHHGAPFRLPDAYRMFNDGKLEEAMEMLWPWHPWNPESAYFKEQAALKQVALG